MFGMLLALLIALNNDEIEEAFWNFLKQQEMPKHTAYSILHIQYGNY